MHLTKFAPKLIWLALLFTCLQLSRKTLANKTIPLKIIDLKNRPAEEIIPVIKPMLKPNDAITKTVSSFF